MLFQEFVFGNVSELSLECISLESLIVIELWLRYQCVVLMDSQGAKTKCMNPTSKRNKNPHFFISSKSEPNGFYIAGKKCVPTKFFLPWSELEHPGIPLNMENDFNLLSFSEALATGSWNESPQVDSLCLCQDKVPLVSGSTASALNM